MSMVSSEYQIRLIKEGKEMDYSIFSEVWDEYEQKFISELGFDPNRWARENRQRFRMLCIEHSILFNFK